MPAVLFAAVQRDHFLYHTLFPLPLGLNACLLYTSLARRRTVIVITHRLANVTDADSIYVLEAGTVAGHGPHAALLAQGGLYKTLWDRQQELEHFGTEEVSA